MGAVSSDMGGTTGPKFLDNPLYVMLRDGQIEAFNRKRPEGPMELRGGNFRGCDLRGANLRDVDLSGGYFRGADLRGLDLSRTRLEGATLAAALISGCLLPLELQADEVRLSLEQGTRLRYRPC